MNLSKIVWKDLNQINLFHFISDSSQHYSSVNLLNDFPHQILFRFRELNEWEWIDLIPGLRFFTNDFLWILNAKMNLFWAVNFSQTFSENNFISFQVGCGAIGCELLKNFALLGLSTGEKGLVSMKWSNVQLFFL